MSCMYSGNLAKAKGKLEGVFEYEDKKFKHYFVVGNGLRSNLLRADILSLIFIYWLQFLKVRLVNKVNLVQDRAQQTG